MKTPEAGLWPMGLMVAGAHVFFGYYLFSEEFLDDFADDAEAPTVVKVSLPLILFNRCRFLLNFCFQNMITVNKKWRDIRENFTAS